MAAADPPEGSREPAQEGLDAAMAVLRERAMARNLQRVEAVAGALERLHEGSLDDESRLRARTAAHSVAGSAGTFGFARATELARQLEALLEERGGGDDQARAQRGLDDLEELRAALAAPMAVDDEVR
jgi:HPt (histidine-containing phosphotransfer) domain-containing protein